VWEMSFFETADRAAVTRDDSHKAYTCGAR
jgi:hypothetical protein